MAKLMIRDMDEGGLAFDLRDVLRALAPGSLAAAWTISPPAKWGFEATGAGGMRLEELADSSATIGGRELLALADDALQVSWGNFVGMFTSDTPERWLTIRAIDSSYYEVETSDQAAIDQLVSHFRTVRFVDGAY